MIDLFVVVVIVVVVVVLFCFVAAAAAVVDVCYPCTRILAPHALVNEHIQPLFSSQNLSQGHILLQRTTTTKTRNI